MKKQNQNMVLLSDLHLESRYKFGGEKFWFDLGMDTLELAHVLSMANEKAPVVFCGDLFDAKDRHPSWIINAVRDSVKKSVEEGVMWYFLLGNHDIGDRNESIVEVLGDIPGVTVVSEPQNIMVGDVLCAFIPYLESTEETEYWAEELCDADVAFLHHGLEGAMTGLGYVFPEGVDEKHVAEYKYVFCGHYHNHQQIYGNVYYLGSPYQLDFGERDDLLKGVWFLDYVKGTITQYEVPGAPRFYHVDVHDVSDFDVKNLDIIDDLHNKDISCIVKIVFHVTRGERAVLNTSDVRKALKKEGALSVTINTKLVDDKTERMQLDEEFTWEAVINAWGEQKSLGEDVVELGLGILADVQKKREGIW